MHARIASAGPRCRLAASSLVMRLLAGVALLLIVASVQSASFIAKAAPASNSFSTDAWLVTYTLSSNVAEPVSVLSLQLEIHALKTSYQFELWVALASPLTLTRQGSDDPHVRYPQLSEAEKRLETFSITVPVSVKVGEVYTINGKAQSYASMPVLLGVIPFSPDFQFDTSGNPARALSVSITGLARLSFGQASYQPSVTRGDSLTLSIPLNNSGRGAARAAKLNVVVPEGLRLTSVSGFANGSDVNAGQTSDITIVLQTVREGTQSLELTLSSQNTQPVKQSISFEVNAPVKEKFEKWLWQYWLLLVVLMIVGVSLLTYLTRRRLESR